MEKIEKRLDVVVMTYSNLIKFAKTIDLISKECSENIEDHEMASADDWKNHVGTCPSLQSTVGEYKGLKTALDFLK